MTYPSLSPLKYLLSSILTNPVSAFVSGGSQLFLDLQLPAMTAQRGYLLSMSTNATLAAEIWARAASSLMVG